MMLKMSSIIQSPLIALVAVNLARTMTAKMLTKRIAATKNVNNEWTRFGDER